MTSLQSQDTPASLQSSHSHTTLQLHYSQTKFPVGQTIVFRGLPGCGAAALPTHPNEKPIWD